MTSALPTRLQECQEWASHLSLWLRNHHGGRAGWVPRSGWVQAAPATLCPGSWEGLVCQHCHPRRPDGSWEGKSLSPGAVLTSAAPISGVSASPSPMPTSTSHCRLYQALTSPLTVSCCAWGPQQDATPPLQAAIDRPAPRCHQPELLFKRLCRRRWAGHRSPATFHVLTAPFPAERAPAGLLCPRGCFSQPSAFFLSPLCHGPAASCPPASVSPAAELTAW